MVLLDSMTAKISAVEDLGGCETGRVDRFGFVLVVVSMHHMYCGDMVLTTMDQAQASNAHAG